MLKKQEQKLQMYQAVIQFCQQHTIVLRHYPELDWELQGFHAVVVSIDALRLQYIQLTTGRPPLPEEAKRNLCTLGAALAGMVMVYAEHAQLDELAKAVKHNYHSLRRCSGPQLIKNCKRICLSATRYGAVLEHYGVLPDTIEILRTAIELFNTVVPPPRNALALNEAFGKQFAFLTDHALLLLRNRVDLLVEKWLKTDEFYAGYWECRHLLKKKPMTTAA